MAKTTLPKKTMPAGEAKPLGTPKKSATKSRTKPQSADATSADTPTDAALTQTAQTADATQSTTTDTTKETSDNSEKAIDNATSAPVASSSLETTSQKDTNIMAETKSITITRSDKERKATSIVYNAADLRGSVRFAKTYFAGGVAPETIVITSDSFATVKPTLTKEERKQLRKNAPKLSAAEKLAKLEERAEKMRKKLAAADAAKPAAEQAVA